MVGWGGGVGGVGGVVGWVGFVFPFWDTQIDIGAGGPFCAFLNPKNVDVHQDGAGEIDFTNDRLKLKINVNPTSWDYSMPFQQ